MECWTIELGGWAEGRFGDWWYGRMGCWEDERMVGWEAMCYFITTVSQTHIYMCYSNSSPRASARLLKGPTQPPKAPPSPSRPPPQVQSSHEQVQSSHEQVLSPPPLTNIYVVIKIQVPGPPQGSPSHVDGAGGHWGPWARLHGHEGVRGLGWAWGWAQRAQMWNLTRKWTPLTPSPPCTLGQAPWCPPASTLSWVSWVTLGGLGWLGGALGVHPS